MKRRPPVLRLAMRLGSGTRYWGLRGYPRMTLYANRWSNTEPVRWWLSFDIPGEEAAFAELHRGNVRRLLKLVKRRYPKPRKRGIAA